MTFIPTNIGVYLAANDIIVDYLPSFSLLWSLYQRLSVFNDVVTIIIFLIINILLERRFFNNTRNC